MGLATGLNETPSAERVHIGFFGRRNVGKSSLVNAVTGQEMSVTSATKGTTTDPVSKAMELLPLGPVVIIDTPGFDDTGTLGEKRVRRTKQILNRVDCAVLVADCTTGLTDSEQELLTLFRQKAIPYLIAYNKCDLAPDLASNLTSNLASASRLTGEKVTDSPASELSGKITDSTAEESTNGIAVSATALIHINTLKDRIAQLLPKTANPRRLVGDLIQPADTVLLVVPIDSSAPKGRLILPQQQAIRDILERGALSVVVRDTEVTTALRAITPHLVITDSQAFGRVSKEVPPSIPLTSFSILMARYKGFLDTAVRGAAAIATLQEGDRILISEGCTHHRQCADIGTVKIPRWLHERTGRTLPIDTSSGYSFPEDLSPYRLIIHCGGCMLNERELRFRQKCAEDAGIPFTNYGVAIAYLHGILKRSLAPFPHLADLLPPLV